ncbi:hypothetical protein C8R47DRAFT_1227879 [Mycena vitilis]|nr:hypothetical protein C8R47DRAFT_1227879 [Mycena vitilis]
MSSYASVSHERDSSFYESPALSEAVPSSVGGPDSLLEPPQPPKPQEDSVKIAQGEQLVTSGSGSSQTIGGHRQANGHAPPTPAPLPPSSFLPTSPTWSYRSSAQSSGVNRLVRMGNFEQLHKYLAGGPIQHPAAADTVKAKYYMPRNPFPTAAITHKYHTRCSTMRQYTRARRDAYVF